MPTRDPVLRPRLKRSMDVAVAGAAVLLLLPLLLTIAGLIVGQSGRPVLHRSRRLGRNGRPFVMLKFRTMRPASAAAAEAPYHARITRIGALLRRYKLDELPQLVNVLRGDMSLVGPRPDLAGSPAGPPLPVRPGLTDYASIRFIELDQQLAGPDPAAAYAQDVAPLKSRLQQRYVCRQSPGEDLRILAATAVALARLATGRRRRSRWNPSRSE